MENSTPLPLAHSTHDILLGRSIEDFFPGSGVTFLDNQLSTSRFILCGDLIVHHGLWFFLLDGLTCPLFSMAVPEVGMG